MQLGISMDNDFDNKEYRVYEGRILVYVDADYMSALKEFRSLQRKRDKEIE
jgi:hypothetical protein